MIWMPKFDYVVTHAHPMCLHLIKFTILPSSSFYITLSHSSILCLLEGITPFTLVIGTLGIILCRLCNLALACLSQLLHGMTFDKCRNFCFAQSVWGKFVWELFFVKSNLFGSKKLLIWYKFDATCHFLSVSVVFMFFFWRNFSSFFQDVDGWSIACICYLVLKHLIKSKTLWSVDLITSNKCIFCLTKINGIRDVLFVLFLLRFW